MQSICRNYTGLPKSSSGRRQIGWERNRLIGIKGARGVGKTTLVLQYLKQAALPSGQSLYVSLDDLYFSAHRLYDLGEVFVRTGGRLLVLDEVHRYANWSQEIKNLYDDFPDLRMVFTGSSIMHLERSKGDLSRRAVMYHLHGLSFREFLRIQGIVSWAAVPLAELLERHQELTLDLTGEVKPLAYWKEYLQHGYYPYFLENRDVYGQKLTETIQLSLELDLPAVYGISYASQQLNTSRALVVEYLHYLEELGILMLLHRDSFGATRLQKPEKVYLSHPNLQYALHASRPDTGTLEESFFLSQVHPLHKVEYTEKGDFRLNRQVTIEVGAANKTRRQVAGLENAWVAADDVEIGHGDKIPLWMFGLLY